MEEQEVRESCPVCGCPEPRVFVHGPVSYTHLTLPTSRWRVMFVMVIADVEKMI